MSASQTLKHGLLLALFRRRRFCMRQDGDDLDAYIDGIK